MRRNLSPAGAERVGGSIAHVRPLERWPLNAHAHWGTRGRHRGQSRPPWAARAHPPPFPRRAPSAPPLQAACRPASTRKVGNECGGTRIGRPGGGPRGPAHRGGRPRPPRGGGVRATPRPAAARASVDRRQFPRLPGDGRSPGTAPAGGSARPPPAPPQTVSRRRYAVVRVAAAAQRVEYIWADGLEGAPEKGTVFNEMRSKVRVCVSLLFLHCFWAFGSTSALDHGNRRLNPLPPPSHRPRSCRSRSPTSRPPTFPTGRSTARPPAKPRATTRTASCAPCPSTPTRCAAGTMSSLCAKSSTRTRRRTRPTRARGCANC